MPAAPTTTRASGPSQMHNDPASVRAAGFDPTAPRGRAAARAVANEAPRPVGVHIDFTRPELYSLSWARGPLSHQVSDQIRQEITARREKATSLVVIPQERSGLYHVDGGSDPDGHDVNLLATGAPEDPYCTCGDHLWRLCVCKHLMAVLLTLLARGWTGARIRNLALAVEIAKITRGFVEARRAA
jgi:hypothetical protein